ncbi:MAG: hypothetical protein KAJ49_06490 [Arcobacteraceae bacterium]|nr:hypothetical protein [Arcobacteraceae bacterium]
MEISNNYSSTTQYIQNNQTDNSSNSNQFEQYMSNNNQKDLQTNTTTSSKKEDYIEVSDTTEQVQSTGYPQNITPIITSENNPRNNYLKFLDDNYPNYFKNNDIPKDAEEAIRAVLADNQLSENEARNLSFEHANILHKMELSRYDYGPTVESDLFMGVSAENSTAQVIIGITAYSKDESLSRAIHKTFAENKSLDAFDMFDIRDELSLTVSQAYNGMDIGFSVHQASAPERISINPRNGQEFDYANHLSTLLNIVDKRLYQEMDPNVREQYELLNVNFGKILENYLIFKNDELE